MSTQPMSDKQRAVMAKARELIQAKNYVEAKRLLQAINHPKAKEWLDKIEDRLLDEALNAPSVAIAPEKQKNVAVKPAKKKPSFVRDFSILVLAVCFGFACWSTLQPAPNHAPIPYDYDAYIQVIDKYYQVWLDPKGYARSLEKGTDGLVLMEIFYDSVDENRTNEIALQFANMVRMSDKYGLVIDKISMISRREGFSTYQYTATVANIRKYMAKTITPDEFRDTWIIRE